MNAYAWARRLVALVGFLTCVAGVAWPVAAQQLGSVAGILTNALSAEPVPSATVIVESPTFTRQTKSGMDGKFTITNVPPGVYHLVIRADVYFPSRTDVTVAAGSLTSNVQLNPELHFSLQRSRELTHVCSPKVDHP